MTAFEQFAADTARLAKAAARLAVIERRHRILEAGFAQLTRGVEREHMLGRSAEAEIRHLARLDRLLAHGETEALCIVRDLLPLLAAGGGRG